MWDVIKYVVPKLFGLALVTGGIAIICFLVYLIYVAYSQGANIGGFVGGIGSGILGLMFMSWLGGIHVFEFGTYLIEKGWDLIQKPEKSELNQ